MPSLQCKKASYIQTMKRDQVKINLFCGHYTKFVKLIGGVNGHGTMQHMERSYSETRHSG